MKSKLLRIAAVTPLVLPVSIPWVCAQGTREDGTGTVAGVLGEPGDAYDDNTFTSNGNEILLLADKTDLFIERQPAQRSLQRETSIRRSRRVGVTSE